jgi:hypothetical protein
MVSCFFKYVATMDLGSNMYDYTKIDLSYCVVNYFFPLKITLNTLMAIFLWRTLVLDSKHLRKYFEQDAEQHSLEAKNGELNVKNGKVEQDGNKES